MFKIITSEEPCSLTSGKGRNRHPAALIVKSDTYMRVNREVTNGFPDGSQKMTVEIDMESRLIRLKVCEDVGVMIHVAGTFKHPMYITNEILKLQVQPIDSVRIPLDFNEEDGFWYGKY